MANYYGVGRTNYFRVTDEEIYKELFAGISAEDVIDISVSENGDDAVRHGFGIYGSLDWTDRNDECPESDLDYFIDEIQKILPEDDALIYMESGHEKLRYVTGYVLIITRECVEWIDLMDLAYSKAKALLGEDFTTELEY